MDRWGSGAWWAHCGLLAAVVAMVELVINLTDLTVGPGVYVVWPVNGVALALLVMWGWRCWPGLVVGFALVPMTLGWKLWEGSAGVDSWGPVLQWLGLVSVDVVQISLTAVVVRRILGPDALLGSLDRAVKLVVVANFLGPLANTAGSMAVMLMAERFAWAELPGVAATWFASDLLGTVVLAPAIVVWSSRSVWGLVAGEWKSWLLGVGALLLVSVVSFSPLGGELAEVLGFGRAGRNLWTYALLLPLVMWMVLRFATAGATLAMCVVSAAAVAGTAMGHGPLGNLETYGLESPTGVWMDPMTLAVVEMQVLLTSLGATCLLGGAVVTERARQQGRLIRQRDRLRRLSRQMLDTEHRERRELATRLHDGVTQYLAVAKLALDQAIETGGQGETECNSTALMQVSGALEHAVQESRSVISDLAPPALTPLGLHAALTALVRQFESEFDFPVLYQGDPPAVRPALAVEAFVHRAAREMLFNTVRHAGASRGGIVYESDEAGVRLTVWDDGRGFDLEAALNRRPQEEQGFGLFSIHEQAVSMGGNLRETTEPKGGVMLVLPG